MKSFFKKVHIKSAVQQGYELPFKPVILFIGKSECGNYCVGAMISNFSAN